MAPRISMDAELHPVSPPGREITPVRSEPGQGNRSDNEEEVPIPDERQSQRKPDLKNLPKRSDSVDSIMQVVRARIEASQAQGTPAAGFLTPSTHYTKRAYRRDNGIGAESVRSGRSTSRMEVMRKKSEIILRAYGVPFWLIIIGPMIIMISVCLGAFVPLTLFSIQTQDAILASYDRSTQRQQTLIGTTVLNATRWVLLEVSLGIEQAVVTQILGPPDNAIESLWGSIINYNQNEQYNGRPGLNWTAWQNRTAIYHRAWEELDNQWRCLHSSDLLTETPCPHVAGVSAISRTGATAASYFDASNWPALMGGNYDRVQFFRGDQAYQIVVDAPPAPNASATSKLSIFNTSDMGYKTGGALGSLQLNLSTDARYGVQATIAAESDANQTSIKAWSQICMNETWAPPGSPIQTTQPWMAWTLPLSFCGNYSCFSGVVSAEVTLDVLSITARKAWQKMASDLRQAPWDYQILENNSAVFVVQQVSPRFRDQEGLLIGSHDPNASMLSSTLIHAIDSESWIVSWAARAMIQKFGGWDHPELGKRGNDQLFHTSIKSMEQGRQEDCDPLTAGLATGDIDCYQVATHTIPIGDGVQWLVVTILPTAAFSHFYAETVMEVQKAVSHERQRAQEKGKQTIVACISVGVITVVVSFSVGIGITYLILRPMSKLGYLMRRLGHLDFEQVGADMLESNSKGHIRELNELMEGFGRLARSIEVFAKFVPEAVVRRLVRGDPRAHRLHVQKKSVTIMFSDIRDFTTISEMLPIKDLMYVLTYYISVMSYWIEHHEGVIGEILGDGILAFWNTPDEVHAHEQKACDAALAQHRALGSLNSLYERDGMPHLSIRIGINTGEVFTGNIGSDHKMKFGCMGDPVNLASRLEGLCKVYGVGIIASGATHEALPSDSDLFFRKLDVVQVKGKKEPTTIYELLGREATLPLKCATNVSSSLIPPNSIAPPSNNLTPVRSLNQSRVLEVRDAESSPPGSSRHSMSVTSSAGQYEDLVPSQRKAQARRYEEALRAYHEARFHDVVQLTQSLLSEVRQDGRSDVAAERLLQRAEDHVATMKAQTGAGQQWPAAGGACLAPWTGVVKMTDK